MHNIEPHFKWRDRYIAEDDEISPFFGRVYSEFTYSHKIYNYFIHPQWDFIGSPTLYMKILFVDYDDGFAIMEFIGEWNDCISNDIMFLKRDIVDLLLPHKIFKYILIGENVLNFHADDNDYYEEWYDDIKENDGWICGINFQEHVIEEMASANLQYYLNFDDPYNEQDWRGHKPFHLYKKIDQLVRNPKQRMLLG